MRNELDCYRCSHFTIHPNYPYIVVCLEKQQIVSESKEVCKKYVEKTWESLLERLSEAGFLYCAECSKPIFTREELTKHKAELIPLEYFNDEVAYEEAYSAD